MIITSVSVILKINPANYLMQIFGEHVEFETVFRMRRQELPACYNFFVRMLLLFQFPCLWMPLLSSIKTLIYCSGDFVDKVRGRLSPFNF